MSVGSSDYTLGELIRVTHKIEKQMNDLASRVEVQHKDLNAKIDTLKSDFVSHNTFETFKSHVEEKFTNGSDNLIRVHKRIDEIENRGRVAWPTILSTIFIVITGAAAFINWVVP